jgi:NAD-dependent dihydropyrimidine dehydrogenase PreA subunit
MPPADDLPIPVESTVARFDTAKAKKAARHPKRPGELCKASPGAYVPEINRNRCEGKSDCVAVCPYDVFEVRRIDVEDQRALSLVGKMKSFAHGGKTAYAVRAADCQACGLCVTACPEKAISLVRAR